MPDTNHGERIQYDPLWKGPVKVRRTQTDSLFNKLFGSFLLLWAAETIYVYYAGGETRFIIRVSVGLGLGKLPAVYTSTDGYRNTYNLSQMLIYDALICHSLTALMIISYIISLRCYAKLVVFLVIASILSMLLAFICYLMYLIVAHSIPTREPLVILLIFLVGLFVVLTSLAVFLKKGIILACILIGEASRVVMFFPSLFLVPFIQLLAYIAVVIHAVIVYALISTLPRLSRCGLPVIYILHSINFLGVYWLVNFFCAFGQMVLCGSYATWFWTSKKEIVSSDTVSHVLRTTSRFHTGTLAFGSLFHTLSQLIRILIDYVVKYLCCINLIPTCSRKDCCTGSCSGFAAVPHYLSKNACIMTAVHGTELIQSGKDAFNLIARNVVNVIVTNRVKYFILVVGYLSAISVSVLMICFHEMQGHDAYEGANYFIISYIAVGSYVIVKAFLSLLSIAVDTLFLCVLEDYERNDGSAEKPYYMSEKLKNLLLN